METTIRKIVAKQGYVFIPQHMPELGTLEAASILGSANILEGFSTIQKLRPHTQSNATPNTYSGNFGTEEFPFHTDLAHWAIPPRYLMLRCIVGSNAVTTSLFDGNLLLDAMGSTLLRRTLVQPRRPLRYGKQLLRLLEYLDGNDSKFLRWDSIFLRPATAESEKTFSLVVEYIGSNNAEDMVLLSLGDTLIIDNWRMMHRRSAVPLTASNRNIERVYLGEIN